MAKSQTELDTERANNRTQQDTARANSRLNGGDGGTADRMSKREAAAGLNLRGNNTTSGRNQQNPTIVEREIAGGLNLAGNNPVSGREDSFYTHTSKIPDNSPTNFVVHGETNDSLPVSQEAFAAIICVNGVPHYASIQGRIGDAIT